VLFSFGSDTTLTTTTRWKSALRYRDSEKICERARASCSPREDRGSLSFLSLVSCCVCVCVYNVFTFMRIYESSSQSTHINSPLCRCDVVCTRERMNERARRKESKLSGIAQFIKSLPLVKSGHSERESSQNSRMRVKFIHHQQVQPSSLSYERKVRVENSKMNYSLRTIGIKMHKYSQKEDFSLRFFHFLNFQQCLQRHLHFFLTQFEENLRCLVILNIFL
jgi:hypothetical protein